MAETNNAPDTPERLPAVPELPDGARNDVRELLNGPRWRRLNAEEAEWEKGELRRTAVALGIDYKSLEHAFDAAHLEELKEEDWSIMSNSDSQDRTWTKEDVIGHIGGKRDHAKIFGGLERGEELPAPIVLYREGEVPYLIAGNTRLLACRAAKTYPQVLAVRL